ncbi:MAG: hypothetical protein HZA49_01400 [Planctomycetes bacterium]|nr:hypothetical protein [Planctomycetota bacterium]
MDEPGGSTGVNPVAQTDSAEQASQLNLPLWNSANQKLDGAKTLTDSEIQIVLQNLFSEDYTTRQKIIAYLNINQHVITRPLVEMLVKNTTHHTLIFQVTYALEVIGKSAVPVLLEALAKIGEIKTPLDVARMENISETLVRINDKSGAAVLADYLRDIKARIDEINKNVNHNNSHTPQDECWWSSDLGKKMEFYQMARMKIHCLLGEMNSPIGFDDLLALLGDGTKRVPGDIIETLAKVGNKHALIPLVRMYPVESEISELGARYIKETCRAIIRREKLSKSDPLFDKLTEAEKDNLSKILSGYKNGNKT